MEDKYNAIEVDKHPTNHTIIQAKDVIAAKYFDRFEEVVNEKTKEFNMLYFTLKYFCVVSLLCYTIIVAMLIYILLS